MAKTVIRTAGDLQDGDEVVFDRRALGGTFQTGVVQEKSIDEDGIVVLMIRVESDTTVVTTPRPREMTQPETPFDQVGSES